MEHPFVSSGAIPKALTIAGSDSGGGAGIQADLKTFHSLKVYGTSVITALTAQNTLGVQGVSNVDPNFVEAQFRSVMDDIGADCAKTGMLSSAATVRKVVQLIREYRLAVVVDPVMISTSGSRLLDEEAVELFRKELFPLALVITPNIVEASVLLGWKIHDQESMRKAAKELHQLGPKYVLLKGGHLEILKNGEKHVVDILFDGTNFIELDNKMIDTKNTHGTGCTLAAAICAYVASGCSVVEAVKRANIFVHNAIADGISVGKGYGPLNHFHNFDIIQPSKRLFQQLKEYCVEDWNQYVNHEFVKQLSRKALPTHKFLEFLRQDYIFLMHFARANAVACSKSTNAEELRYWSAAISDSVKEAELHVEICKGWGITRAELEATVPSVWTLSYTNFVLEKGLTGDMLDLRVVMAPCAVGYGEIARILSSGRSETSGQSDAFDKWLDLYKGEWFQSGAREAEDLLDDIAKKRGMSEQRFQQLAKDFKAAVQLEIMFFQHAWTFEQT
eukprot:TRINITY_DN6178_c0_g1_i1.p1 TRINITY_DN6178_c0_g1~~TRINITY_DN6178_c0_g1_i1.p1  ORF type:complete len:504 (+),score=82.45 TRINITY_DN6178_c0_g1_i1:96-1607(+)